MIHLIKGKEQFIRRQTVDKIIASGKKQSPDLNVVRILAKNYSKGDISNLTSPSILGDASLLIIEEAENTNDALIEDVVKLCERFSKNEKIDAAVIIEHSGAVRGKKMIDALTKAVVTKSVMVHEAAEMKKPAEKIAFVQVQAKNYGKTIANDASDALVQYAGDDLAVLSGYIKQLASDIGEEKSSISLETVQSFFKAVLKVDVWDIINAAVGGNSYQAIMLFRHAVQNGQSVAGLVPLFNKKLMDIAKVSGISSGKATASSLGMAPWMVTNLQREAKNFTTEKLKQSFVALSDADLASKSGIDNGALAFESALRTIAGRGE
jgi:DNA polymerase-3 subunit delta